MAINYNPRSVTDGLVLNLDAANSRSLVGVNSNLLTFSEDFSNAVWVKDSATITPNQVVAPDSTLTADLLVASVRMYWFDNTGIKGSKVQSIFAKQGAGTSITIQAVGGQAVGGGATVTVNLTTGAVTSGHVAPNVTVSSAGNGFWRIAILTSVSVASGNSTYWQILSTPGIYIWGAQLESGLTVTTYYPVNSISPSSTWKDLSTNGLTATLIGNPAYNSLYGGCLNFTGTQTATVTNPLIQSNTLQEWTVCAWVNVDNTSGQNLLNFNNGLYPVYSASGSLLYLNGGANDYYTYGGTFGLQGWSYATFRFKNSTGTRTIYKNGVSVTTSGPNNTSTPSGIPLTLTIGTNLRGSLAKLEIYNRLLTDTEVRQNFNALRGRYGL